MKFTRKTKPSFLYILAKRLQRKHFLYEFYFKGKKTLDIGCGEGEFIKNDPNKICGVDANERVIQALKNRGLQAVVGNVGQLPFKDGEFEAVHCRNVIEHLPVEYAYSLLKEAARILQSGGLFVLASETVTKKFWDTFGHIKPYPPEAVIKLFREESREEFDGIEGLEYVDILYFGEYFQNKFFYALSVFLAPYVPSLRREYFLILRKK